MNWHAHDPESRSHNKSLDIFGAAIRMDRALGKSLVDSAHVKSIVLPRLLSFIIDVQLAN